MSVKLDVYVSENSKLLSDVQYEVGGVKLRYPENGKHPREVLTDIKNELKCVVEVEDELIILTNSSVVLTAISDYIADVNKDFKDCVSVHILGFEGVEERIATFDEEGDLIDWPIGFFSCY